MNVVVCGIILNTQRNIIFKPFCTLQIAFTNGCLRHDSVNFFFIFGLNHRIDKVLSNGSKRQQRIANCLRRRFVECFHSDNAHIVIQIQVGIENISELFCSSTLVILLNHCENSVIEECVKGIFNLGVVEQFTRLRFKRSDYFCVWGVTQRSEQVVICFDLAKSIQIDSCFLLQKFRHVVYITVIFTGV